MYIHGTGIEPVGVTFEFSLLLTDGFTLIEGTAEVLRVSFDENGMTNGMGVRFVELVGDSARLVRRIVAKHRNLLLALGQIAASRVLRVDAQHGC